MTKTAGAPSTSGYPYQGVKDTEIRSSETRSTRRTPSSEPTQHDKSLYSQYNIPTARPLPPPCFREAFKLKRVCSLNKQQKAIKGDNITLEDVAQIVFSKSTLKALKVRFFKDNWSILVYKSCVLSILKLFRKCLNSYRKGTSTLLSL